MMSFAIIARIHVRLVLDTLLEVALLAILAIMILMKLVIFLARLDGRLAGLYVCKTEALMQILIFFL